MQAHKTAIAALAIAMALGVASGSPMAGGGNVRVGITIAPSCDIHRPGRGAGDAIHGAVRVSCSAHVPHRIRHARVSDMAVPPRTVAAVEAGRGGADVVVTTVVF